MKYLWLSLGALFTVLAIFDQPVAIAGWLAPLFLLRFLRQSRGLPGYFTALAVLSLVVTVCIRGMTPAPLVVFAASVVVGFGIGLLPYVMDRLLGHRFSPEVATLILPAGAVSLEFLISLSANGTWGSTAYALVGSSSLLQVVSVTGIWGLVFLPFWAAAVGNLVWEKGLTVGASRRALAAFALVVAGALFWGELRLSLASAASSSVRVAGVMPSPQEREEMQESIGALFGESQPSPELIDSFRDLQRRVGERMMATSRELAAGGARVVVWSEAAVATLASDEPTLLNEAGRLAADQEIYLGLAYGVADDDFQAKLAVGDPFVEIRLVLFEPSGAVAWSYAKSKLVPGFPEARIARPGDGVLLQGEAPFGVVSGVICYDLDFPRLLRSAGQGGVSLLLGPANDWPEIRHKHALMARVRAVENGFALFRPTSGGLSIASDAYGRVLGQGDYGATGGAPLVVELPLAEVSTVYSIIGDLFAYLCLAISGAFLAVPLWRRRWFSSARDGRGHRAGRASV